MQQRNSNYTFITAKMKMADVLACYNNLIILLPRLGISLGFGEKTVKQVCEDNGVSLPLFLLVCNAYTQDDYIPESEELQNCNIDDFLKYLKASHDDYIDNEFPHIEHHLHDVMQDWNEKYRSTILKFFEEYKKEVVCHFQHEEDVIFPYIQDLKEKRKPRRKKFSIADFDRQHDNIEDKLRDFTNLLIKYIPADVAQRERIFMLIDIFSLSDDIEKHAILEEKILIPYIKTLENNEI